MPDTICNQFAPSCPPIVHTPSQGMLFQPPSPDNKVM